MITEHEYTVHVFGTVSVWHDKRSDFKDGEQPLYTGHKRNYRKARYSKHDYWTERWEVRPRCWKDQRGKGRNKRTTQYRPVVMA